MAPAPSGNHLGDRHRVASWEKNRIVSEVAPFIPLLVEATRFAFTRLGQWLDRSHAQDGVATPPESAQQSDQRPALTSGDFDRLVSSDELRSVIDRQVASAQAYSIQGLLNQLQTHARNLSDYETQEAEFGSATPPHVRRGIERERAAIAEKGRRLRALLEQVYGRRLVIE
jgi:hypothetical protein